jgi:hypothetical protein
MREKRLNYPSIPTIEKDITISLSYEEAIKKYAVKNIVNEIL